MILKVVEYIIKSALYSFGSITKYTFSVIYPSISLPHNSLLSTLQSAQDNKIGALALGPNG